MWESNRIFSYVCAIFVNKILTKIEVHLLTFVSKILSLDITWLFLKNWIFNWDILKSIHFMQNMFLFEIKGGLWIINRIFYANSSDILFLAHSSKVTAGVLIVTTSLLKNF